MRDSNDYTRFMFSESGNMSGLVHVSERETFCNIDVEHGSAEDQWIDMLAQWTDHSNRLYLYSNYNNHKNIMNIWCWHYCYYCYEVIDE